MTDQKPDRQDDGLLPCPLCQSITIAVGTCFVEASIKHEPAVRCYDCGCRATLKAWNTRTPPSRDAAEPVALTSFRFVQVAFAQFKEPELRKIVDAISKQFAAPPVRGDRESLAKAYALHRWQAKLDNLPNDMVDDCYGFAGEALVIINQ